MRDGSMPSGVQSQPMTQYIVGMLYLDVVGVEFNRRVGVLYGIPILFKLDIRLLVC